MKQNQNGFSLVELVVAEARPSRNINSQEQNTVNYDGVDFWLTRSKDASNADTIPHLLTQQMLNVLIFNLTAILSISLNMKRKMVV